MNRKKSDVDLTYIAEALRPLAVPIADLVLDQRNAKIHGERDLTAIAASLRTFGVRTPAVVRRADRRVLKGNGSLRAAQELCGWTHYPVVFVDDDERTATGYALADNRTSELAEWDAARVQELLAEVEFDSLDDDLARMGADFLAELDEIAGAAHRAAEDVVGPPAAQPERKRGDNRSQTPPAEKWQIVITCRDETHQSELLERFESEGLTCRALIS